MKSIKQRIEEGQRECKKCIDDFTTFNGQFSPKFCKACEHGIRLHKLEVKVSDSEKKWGTCDWNSSQYTNFYNG